MRTKHEGRTTADIFLHPVKTQNMPDTFSFQTTLLSLVGLRYCMRERIRKPVEAELHFFLSHMDIPCRMYLMTIYVSVSTCMFSINVYVLVSNCVFCKHNIMCFSISMYVLVPNLFWDNNHSFSTIYLFTLHVHELKYNYCNNITQLLTNSETVNICNIFLHLFKCHHKMHGTWQQEHSESLYSLDKTSPNLVPNSLKST